jgi:hypothetical protein
MRWVGHVVHKGERSVYYLVRLRHFPEILGSVLVPETGCDARYF